MIFPFFWPSEVRGELKKRDGVFIFLFFGVVGTILIGLIHFFFQEFGEREISREIITAEVVQANIEERGKKGRRHQVIVFKLRTSSGEWWSTDEVRFDQCPRVQYHQPKNIWLVGLGNKKYNYQERYETRGLVTFCQK